MDPTRVAVEQPVCLLGVDAPVRSDETAIDLESGSSAGVHQDDRCCPASFDPSQFSLEFKISVNVVYPEEALRQSCKTA